MPKNLQTPPNLSPDIEQLRVEIDAIDTQLLQLLSKRMHCAQSIGQYKKERNLPILQVARWHEILNIAVQRGQNLGLSSDFVTQFLTAIHDESIRHQKLVMQEEDNLIIH
jgi:chorismate mutase